MSRGSSTRSRTLFAFACTTPVRRFMTLIDCSLRARRDRRSTARTDRPRRPMRRDFPTIRAYAERLRHRLARAGWQRVTARAVSSLRCPSLCPFVGPRPPRRRGVQGRGDGRPLPRRGRPHGPRHLHRRRGRRDLQPGARHRRGARQHRRPSAAASSTPPRRRSATTRSSCSATGTRGCPTRRPTPTHARLPPRRSTRRSAGSSPRSAGCDPRSSSPIPTSRAAIPTQTTCGSTRSRSSPSTPPGDPDAYPEAGEPFQPLKLYYSIWQMEAVIRRHEKFLELGLESPYAGWFDEDEDRSRTSGRSQPTTLIDVTRDYYDARRAGLLAHATQIDPTSPFWFGLPEEIDRTIWTADAYRPGAQPRRADRRGGRPVRRGAGAGRPPRGS